MDMKQPHGWDLLQIKELSENPKKIKYAENLERKIE